MRKGSTLKPKIWNSTATLHFWDTGAKNKGTQYDVDGRGCDPEQVAHGRIHSTASKIFDDFVPTMFGSSPHEYRSLAIQNRTGKKWW